MPERFYISNGSRCGSCGCDLGPQEVWTVIFTDDDPQLVERVRSGTINWVRCPEPKCEFEGAWLWPPAFVFIDAAQERGAAATVIPSTEAGFAALRYTLDIDAIRDRGLNAQRILARSKLVRDYRELAAAIESDVALVEQENAAILRFLERRQLAGVQRVEAILETCLESGAVSFEDDELRPEFLAELQAYRTGLAPGGDERIPFALDQIIEHLRTFLEERSGRRAWKASGSMLAEVRASTRAKADHVFAKASFERGMVLGEREAIDERLAFLSRLQAAGTLDAKAMRAIDFNLAFRRQFDAQMASGETADAELHALANFLDSCDAPPTPGELPNIGIGTVGAPPEWLGVANKALASLSGSSAGMSRETAMQPVAHLPVARAYIDSEIGRRLLLDDELSGAMAYITSALRTLETEVGAQERSSSYWIARLHAVCLERMGSLQLRFNRIEDCIRAMRGARATYERVGAMDGARYVRRSEAAIWLDLGQTTRAEELYSGVLAETAGSASADEVRDLANLSNVYRGLRPFANATLSFSKSPREPNEADGPIAGEPEAIAPDDFASKGGIRIEAKIEGHDELSYFDMSGSEAIRLLYRAVSVAQLNGDERRANEMLERLASLYHERNCDALSFHVVDRVLEKVSLEGAGIDAQMIFLNELRIFAEREDDAGKPERARAARAEALELIEFIRRVPSLKGSLAEGELHTERIALLEALDRLDEARTEYAAVIDKLERARAWMRDSDNKRGLQAGRWRPYVRAARNCLRMWKRDEAREELLTEAWQHIESGRSRVLLDSIASQPEGADREEGIASARPRRFADIAARLPPQTAVLEYFLMPATPGCPGMWAMMVVEPGATAPQLAWHQPDMEGVLDAQQRVASLAAEFERQTIQIGHTTEMLEKDYVGALEDLGDVLIPANLLSRLRARGIRRLVIVADAYLHDVPFAALRPIQDGRRGFLGLPKGGRGFEIIYAPSSTIFDSWTARASADRHGHRPRASLFIDPIGDLTQASPQIEKVFGAIETSLREGGCDVEKFGGERAVPDTWLREARQSDLILYFGHSIADLDDIEQAALALNDGNGKTQLLPASEIYRASATQPFARQALLLLASCSGGLTHPGGWDSHRELTGLSVAHLQGGCRAVIAGTRSLFVSPTLQLIEAFLGEFSRGEDAATSLARAQLSLAESGAGFGHPHFWGYLGLMGSPDMRFQGSAGS